MFVQLEVSTEVPLAATAAGEAVKVQIGAPAGTPVPLSITECGLPMALLVTVTELTVLTAEVGVKLTPKLQLAPAATVLPQLLVRLNTLLFLTMLVMVRGALPVLVSVTVLAALVVPTL